MDEFPSLAYAFERSNFQPWEIHLYTDREIAQKVNRPQSEVSRFRQTYTQSFNLPQCQPLAHGSVKINTGIPILNAMLGGGLERGSVTEIFGSSAAGKTCLCCQIALANPNAIYVLTENNPQIIRARMEDIAAASHDDLETINSLKFQKINSANALRVFLNLYLRHRNQADVPVIIIDSITPLFHGIAFNEEHEQHSLMSDLGLRKIAAELNCAIVFTNQVRDTKRKADERFPIYQFERQVELVEGDAGLASQHRKRPAYGYVIANYVDTRLMLIRPSSFTNHRRAYLYHSRYAVPGVVHLSMSEAGLVEDQEVPMDESSLISMLSSQQNSDTSTQC